MDLAPKTYTATQLGEEMGLDATTVGKIFASVKTKRSNKLYNVGLKIKSTSRGVANPEWAQYVNGRWYYGENARAALREYVRLFPTIVRAIAGSGGSIYFDGDFSDDELQRCYEWTRMFREKTYRRVELNSGKDVTGLR